MESIVHFEQVTFAYLNREAPAASDARGLDDLNLVFDDFSLDIPHGVTSVLGQNGVGKSTFLLLAAGRIFPHEGAVTLKGRDTRDFIHAVHEPTLEEERSRLASFVYQNLELESEVSLGEILDDFAHADPDFASSLPDLVETLELRDARPRRLQELSKGEHQRAIIAISLGYGSDVLFMDEPVFALEDDQKRKAFAWLRRFCTEKKRSLVYCTHEIELCRDYADNMVLFSKDKSCKIGPPQEIASQDNLEAAYQAPLATLYEKERLHREHLRRRAGLRG